MALKVCKFGGTSLAARAQIEKCLDIMLSEKTRKVMVVSAPGTTEAIRSSMRLAI